MQERTIPQTRFLIALAFACLLSGTLPAQATVCRLMSLNGFERPHRMAVGLLAGKTSDPAKLEALFTVERGELYVHSNFLTPGYDFATKIGGAYQVSLERIVESLLFAESWRVNRDLVTEVAREGRFYITPELRQSSYFSILDFSASKNVYQVSRSAFGTYEKRLAPESREFMKQETKRLAEEEWSRKREAAIVAAREAAILAAHRAAIAHRQTQLTQASEQVALLFSSTSRKEKALRQLERELEQTPGNWQATPGGRRLTRLIGAFQYVLHRLGEGIAVDGVAGPETIGALTAYAKKQGATATIETLLPYIKREVRGVQQALNREGISVTIDGRWGRQTSQGVAELQRGRGLPVSGRLDVTTRDALADTPAGTLSAPAPRDLDRGFALGRRLSPSADLGGTLARDGAVEIAFKLGDGHYAVKLREAAGWLRIRAHDHPSTLGLDLRSWSVASIEGDHPKIVVTPIHRSPFEHSLEPGDYLAFSRPAHALSNPMRVERIRGPPHSRANTAIDVYVGEGAPLAVTIDARQTVAVRWSSVPTSLRSHLGLLGRILSAEAPAIAAAANGGNTGDRIIYTLGSDVATGKEPGAHVLAMIRRDAESSQTVTALRRHDIRRIVESSAQQARRHGTEAGIRRLDAADPTLAPELSIQKALLLLDAGLRREATGAVDTRKEALDVEPLEEVMGRLQSRRGASYANLERLVGMRNAVAQRAAPEGRVVPFFDGKDLNFGFRWSQIPEGRIRQMGKDGAIFESNAAVYVQDPLLRDMPWLASIDMSGLVSSLHTLVMSAQTVVVELPGGVVGRYRPGKIFTDKTVALFARTNSVQGEVQTPSGATTEGSSTTTTSPPNAPPPKIHLPLAGGDASNVELSLPDLDGTLGFTLLTLGCDEEEKEEEAVDRSRPCDSEVMPESNTLYLLVATDHRATTEIENANGQR